MGRTLWARACILVCAAALSLVSLPRRTGCVVSRDVLTCVERVLLGDDAAVDRHAIAKVAEPLLEGLTPGKHTFQLVQFQALAAYLFGEDTDRLEKAIATDKFSIRVSKTTRLDVVCDRELNTDNTVTLTGFARAHGVPRQTLADWSVRHSLRFIRVGNRKCYDPKDLSRFLTASGDVIVIGFPVTPH
jgi:hypothetical protein